MCARVISVYIELTFTQGYKLEFKNAFKLNMVDRNLQNVIMDI